MSTAPQLAAETSSGPVFWAADPPQLSIDSNGNLTQKIEGSDTWTYEWDAENRLKRVLKNAAEVARFAYDPLGRRVEKVAGGVTSTWTYDGEAIFRETSGSTTLKYVHGSGVDEPLAQEDGAGALSFFHTDGLGSVAKTTNSAGAVVTSRRYDSFGNVEVGATNGYAFTGREWDNETGLAYYRARYYDPKIGRFLSEDPLGPDRVEHLYSYAENDPISNRDPSGLAAVRCVGCRRGQKARIRAIARTFCDNVSGNPRCQMTLRQMMPMSIVRCVQGQCRGRTPVRCGPACGPPHTQAGATQGGQCGLMDRPDLEIIIREPAFSSQSGLAETFGHEFMHLCGLGADPGGRSNPNPMAAANAESADMVGKMCAVGP